MIIAAAASAQNRIATGAATSDRHSVACRDGDHPDPNAPAGDRSPRGCRVPCCWLLLGRRRRHRREQPAIRRDRDHERQGLPHRAVDALRRAGGPWQARLRAQPRQDQLHGVERQALLGRDVARRLRSRSPNRDPGLRVGNGAGRHPRWRPRPAGHGRPGDGKPERGERQARLQRAAPAGRKRASRRQARARQPARRARGPGGPGRRVGYLAASPGTS